MPEWQDSSHSLQEGLDTEMDLVGAKSCFHWRSWRGWRNPIQLFLVSFCGWSQRGDVPGPHECTSGNMNLEAQNPGMA